MKNYYKRTFFWHNNQFDHGNQSITWLPDKTTRRECVWHFSFTGQYEASGVVKPVRGQNLRVHMRRSSYPPALGHKKLQHIFIHSFTQNHKSLDDLDLTVYRWSSNSDPDPSREYANYFLQSQNNKTNIPQECMRASWGVWFGLR